MTTVLPLNTVVHITDFTGRRYGYGLEVRPARGEPAQHWLLYSNHPPATREGEPMMLPAETTWEPTNDQVWRDATTVARFLTLVDEVIANSGTIYAAVHYSNDKKQPDVGGFQLYQRGIIVGVGWVTFDNGVYQEAWNLGDNFNSAAGFGFKYTQRFQRSDEDAGVRARDTLQKLEADPADYLTTVLFDVRYYSDRVPQR